MIYRDQTFDALRLKTLVKTYNNKQVNKPKWPLNKPVVFNFRMPCDNKKQMLFERLHYMIDQALAKKTEDVTRMTNRQIRD